AQHHVERPAGHPVVHHPRTGVPPIVVLEIHGGVHLGVVGAEVEGVALDQQVGRATDLQRVVVGVRDHRIVDVVATDGDRVDVGALVRGDVEGIRAVDVSHVVALDQGTARRGHGDAPAGDVTHGRVVSSGVDVDVPGRTAVANHD